MMSGTSAVNQAETFVFLDIETTGFRDPKITELAMLVMPREDFMPQRNGTSRRALNKWTSLFNPDKPIEAKASEITGLTNDMLGKYNKFDKNAATSIMSYLSHYPKPICLIAHNGRRFDFPIIRKSFENVGVDIPDYIVCSDSLAILKELENGCTGPIDRDQGLESSLLLGPCAAGGTIAKQQRKSFKLSEVHKRLFNCEPVVAHFAEEDVEILHKVATFYGDEFIKIAEKLAFTFSQVRGNTSN